MKARFLTVRENRNKHGRLLTNLVVLDWNQKYQFKLMVYTHTHRERERERERRQGERETTHMHIPGSVNIHIFYIC